MKYKIFIVCLFIAFVNAKPHGYKPLTQNKHSKFPPPGQYEDHSYEEVEAQIPQLRGDIVILPQSEEYSVEEYDNRDSHAFPIEYTYIDEGVSHQVHSSHAQASASASTHKGGDYYTHGPLLHKKPGSTAHSSASSTIKTSSTAGQSSAYSHTSANSESSQAYSLASSNAETNAFSSANSNAESSASSYNGNKSPGNIKAESFAQAVSSANEKNGASYAESATFNGQENTSANKKYYNNGVEFYQMEIPTKISTISHASASANAQGINKHGAEKYPDNLFLQYPKDSSVFSLSTANSEASAHASTSSQSKEHYINNPFFQNQKESTAFTHSTSNSEASAQASAFSQSKEQYFNKPLFQQQNNAFAQATANAGVSLAHASAASQSKEKYPDNPILHHPVNSAAFAQATANSGTASSQTKEKYPNNPFLQHSVNSAAFAQATANTGTVSSHASAASQTKEKYPNNPFLQHPIDSAAFAQSSANTGAASSHASAASQSKEKYPNNPILHHPVNSAAFAQSTANSGTASSHASAASQSKEEYYPENIFFQYPQDSPVYTLSPANLGASAQASASSQSKEKYPDNPFLQHPIDSAAFAQSSANTGTASSHASATSQSKEEYYPGYTFFQYPEDSTTFSHAVSNSGEYFFIMPAVPKPIDSSNPHISSTIPFIQLSHPSLAHTSANSESKAQANAVVNTYLDNPFFHSTQLPVKPETTFAQASASASSASKEHGTFFAHDGTLINTKERHGIAPKINQDLKYNSETVVPQHEVYNTALTLQASLQTGTGAIILKKEEPEIEHKVEHGQNNVFVNQNTNKGILETDKKSESFAHTHLEMEQNSQNNVIVEQNSHATSQTNQHAENNAFVDQNIHNSDKIGGITEGGQNNVFANQNNDGSTVNNVVVEQNTHKGLSAVDNSAPIAIAGETNSHGQNNVVANQNNEGSGVNNVVVDQNVKSHASSIGVDDRHGNVDYVEKETSGSTSQGQNVFANQNNEGSGVNNVVVEQNSKNHASSIGVDNQHEIVGYVDKETSGSSSGGQNNVIANQNNEGSGVNNVVVDQNVKNHASSIAVDNHHGSIDFVEKETSVTASQGQNNVIANQNNDGNGVNNVVVDQNTKNQASVLDLNNHHELETFVVKETSAVGQNNVFSNQNNEGSGVNNVVAEQNTGEKIGYQETDGISSSGGQNNVISNQNSQSSGQNNVIANQNNAGSGVNNVVAEQNTGETIGYLKTDGISSSGGQNNVFANQNSQNSGQNNVFANQNNVGSGINNVVAEQNTGKTIGYQETDEVPSYGGQNNVFANQNSQSNGQNNVFVKQQNSGRRGFGIAKIGGNNNVIVNQKQARSVRSGVNNVVVSQDNQSTIGNNNVVVNQNNKNSHWIYA